MRKKREREEQPNTPMMNQCEHGIGMETFSFNVRAAQSKPSATTDSKKREWGLEINEEGEGKGKQSHEATRKVLSWMLVRDGGVKEHDKNFIARGRACIKQRWGESESDRWKGENVRSHRPSSTIHPSNLFFPLPPALHVLPRNDSRFFSWAAQYIAWSVDPFLSLFVQSSSWRPQLGFFL